VFFILLGPGTSSQAGYARANAIGYVSAPDHSAMAALGNNCIAMIYSPFFGINRIHEKILGPGFAKP